MLLPNWKKLPELEITPAMQFIRSLFAERFLEEKTNGACGFTYLEYITRASLERAMQHSFENGYVAVHPDFWRSTAIRILENSGFIRIAFDEDHFPAQKNIGISQGMVDMAKYALGIFMQSGKKVVSFDELRDLLQKQLALFETWNEELIEQPIIRTVVLLEILPLINSYLQW
ncbi:MAG: hypothetical protein LWX56_09255 [Ignavibacteria bacterium]|nr:hypothetical protein [Ignavibacteria bacterium]